MVAGAVILPKYHNIKGLNDSKKISPKRRGFLYDNIFETAISVGIGIVESDIIDKINIRNATFLAMEKAINNLDVKPERCLIDGEKLIDFKIPNEGIIKGDNTIEQIMAASIIAKVTRDRIMMKHSLIFPKYGFEKNKGYGTRLHIEALKKHFATPIHRKTFNPVSKYVLNRNIKI